MSIKILKYLSIVFVFHTIYVSKVVAEQIKVATDISPIYALVLSVMKGVNEPELIIQHGKSPHHHSLKPSEAKALYNADLVFYVGEGISPSFVKALENTKKSAKIINLSEVKNLNYLPYREGASFEEDDHDHGEHHDDEHEHDKHHDDEDHHDDEHGHDKHHDDEDHHDDEHGHDKHHDDEHGHDKHHDDEDHHADEHGHDKHHDDEHGHDKHHDDEHGHDKHHDDEHGHDKHHDEKLTSFDPHLWLSPSNAKIWLNAIYNELKNIDESNSEIYFQNTQKALKEIDESVIYVEKQIINSESLNFIVFHDAYQYFEDYFKIFASGSIMLGDASQPTPSRLLEIEKKLKDLKINCAFSEPQYSGEIISLFGKKYNVPVGVIDPLGSSLELNASFYPNLLKAIGDSINSCRS